MGVTVKDGVWRALLKRTADLHSVRARVGVLASKGGDVKHEGSDLTLVELAAIHEFGAPAAHIPERSFIRSTFYVRRVNALRALCERLTKEVISGHMPARRAVGLLGTWAATECRTTITEIDIPPPLADATVQAKGSSKPLVDTGQLLNAITWELVKS